MNKKILDRVFKVVVILVAFVFISGRFFNFNEPTTEIYGGENSVGTQYEAINTSQPAEVSGEPIQGVVEDGVQIIEFDLQSNGFPTIDVEVGKPVRLIINADESALNSCNYVIVSLDYGIEQQLDVGQNIIEFTPTQTGQFVYSCWMGMLGAYINVYDDVPKPTAYYGGNVSQGGCCSF